MEKSTHLTRVALIIASVLILIAVALSAYFLLYTDRTNIIEVCIAEDEDKIVEFKNLSIVPGGEYEFIIKLTGEFDAVYDISMKFVESDGLVLKDYVYARIEDDQQVFCDDLLANVFKEEIFHFERKLYEKKSHDIRVVYYMDEEVGNEVQQASAEFELLISVSSQEEVNE